jgi:hypothetical protein
VVVSLGGKVENLNFKLPGADHHARWMSKGIYFIKMWLLSRVFPLSEEEKDKIRRIFNFTVVFYAKAWFLSPLPASAARNDLEFHSNMLKYRLLEPKAAFKVLQSVRRHQWYLTPQTIAFALSDPGMEVEEREQMAKTLFATPRLPINTGRPKVPELVWECEGKEVKRQQLYTLVTHSSWLIFDLLKLYGRQVG